MLLDDLMPKYHVMAAVLSKQQENTPHDCTDCPVEGCENCNHDWQQLPNCGERCSQCHQEVP